MIWPLTDSALRSAATVRPALDLSTDTDIVIARLGFRPDVYIERELDRAAGAALERANALVVIGRP